MEKWSDGIYLLGRYHRLAAGCWLLVNGYSGAILEMPPYHAGESSPVLATSKAAHRLGITIKYLLCSHTHPDHFSIETAHEFQFYYPRATFCLQSGFYNITRSLRSVHYFDDTLTLHLDDEPLFLVHAPKHSWTDTMTVFRGVIFTGDWELNTLHSVNQEVPEGQRHHSIHKMLQFPYRYNYRIHKAFSGHADDRRENLDFAELMSDTLVPRNLW